MFRNILLYVTLAAAPLMAASPPRVLAWDEEIAGRKLAFVAGKELIKLEGLSSLRRTPPLALKAAGPYQIRALDKAPGPDAKPIELACPIPETVEKPLIVLLPDKVHPTGLRVIVVDDNPAGFRWGSYRFLNATPKELIVQLEKKAVKVPTGWKPIDLDLGGETRGIGARIALSESIEVPLYSAVWEYNTNIRTLCFLVPGDDPRLSPVAFKAIPEDKIMLQLEAKEQQTADKNG